MTDVAPDAADFVAALVAVDPVGLGGVVLRSAAGPERERWLARLAALLPKDTPWRRVPARIGEDRLLGGLDLAATLQAGRPIAQRGLLAEADGGVVLLAMAERIDPATAAHVATVLDTGELVAERDGIGSRLPSRVAVIALDEGLDDDERTPARLRERLAFHLTLVPGRARDPAPDAFELSRAEIADARLCLPGVRIDERSVEALCEAADALGVASARAAVFATRVARACAALDGRDVVDANDAALAAALVLAPRATRLPAREAESSDDPTGADEPPPPAATADEERSDDEPSTPAEPPTNPPPDDDGPPAPNAAALDERILEAAIAALPPDLLAKLALGAPARAGAAASGTSGATRTGKRRGRPTGARRGEPQAGARLSLIETLRAAAPWQPLRRREAAAQGQGQGQGQGQAQGQGQGQGQGSVARVQVRREDFHVVRFRQRTETTTVFVVDASGSSALHRLAEAKGAVETLLADCYVRRDSVAVIAFRGPGAELLLPPTRSLVRAKRSLAGLPGGGATPLAAGIASAHALATAVRRRGATPLVVLLTDGRANIARDGTPGRARATTDATAAAQALRLDGFAALLLDTSPQPQATARDLAAALGARYLPLPYAGATLLSQVVRQSY